MQVLIQKDRILMNKLLTTHNVEPRHRIICSPQVEERRPDLVGFEDRPYFRRDLKLRMQNGVKNS